VDFSLNDEQEQMQNAASDLLESIETVELARRRMEGDTDAVDELWDQLAEADYTALTVPFEYDGLGDGMLYLSVLLEVAGRYAMPGPYPETMAFAVPLLSELGTEAQCERYLPDVAHGTCRLSFALYDPDCEPFPDGVQLSATATDDGYRLDGATTLVPYGNEVDHVVVAGRTDSKAGLDGISLFIVDTADLGVTALDSLDQSRPLARVDFDDVSVDEDALLGDEDAGGDPLVHALDRYAVATSAMLVGAADRSVDLSVEHGNEREQFGHPIGRYQAVKHRTVDMWMTMQASRSLLYYAGWALDNDAADAPRAVSSIKTFCSENAATLFRDDIQNHGGMGYTWDHDGHIYLKQAKAWEQFPRSADYHWNRIADSRGF
jgi:alkylation response protein AidB-like acyl-CoA dehydrogenase